jgi:hypothetical protein
MKWLDYFDVSEAYWQMPGPASLPVHVGLMVGQSALVTHAKVFR